MKLMPEIIAECRWFIELMAERGTAHLRPVLDFSRALDAGSPVLHRRLANAWSAAYVKNTNATAPLNAENLLRVARLFATLAPRDFDEQSSGSGAVFETRRSLKMSQSTFAAWLGVSSNTVAQWEKRGTTPDMRYPGGEIFWTCAE